MVKKVLQILTAAVLSVAFVGSMAGAQSPTCSSIVITNTGPNSNNQGTCTVNVNVVATCVNNVFALDNNQQAAATGAASTVGNTTAGTAISGSATNSNGQTVTLGSSCGTAVATPTPSVTPSTTPGKGSINPASVAALPYTSGNSTADVVAFSLIAAAAVVVLSRVAVAAYRRIGTK